MQEAKTTITDSTVVEAVWNWVNTWPDMPPGIDEINLDALEKHPPAMILQPVPATVVEREYINGSFLGKWPFSIVVKKNVGDDADRIDAHAAINAIGKWMSEQPLPDLPNNNTAKKIEMTTLPMKSGVDQSGAEYFEAAFALTYNHYNKTY